MTTAKENGLPFPNVPERLAKAVSGLAAIVDVTTSKRYVFASFGVAVEYLGMRSNDPDAEEFFRRLQTNALGGPWHGWVERTVLVGDTLFALRSCVGFSDFCERLKQRNFKSTFYELFSAKLLLEADFAICGRPITYVKTRDFDFHAIRNGQQVNVEVTALSKQGFSEITLRNALNKKRRQVPNTEPAIIFCVLPESWSEDPQVWKSYAPAICTAFLSSTRRVTAVVLLMEHNIGQSNAGEGAFIIHKQVFLNDNPYFQIADTSFLFRTILLPTLEQPYSGMTGEFFQWVDSLLPARS
jgi:hypothetical protein